MHNFKAFPTWVKLVEVGPRDGLQNVTQTVSLEKRIALIHELTATGLTCIEVGSFVSPEKVPQMQGTDLVLRGLKKQKACTYPVLTPNMHGLNNALDAGATCVAIFGSASETFCQKNIGCTVLESLDHFDAVLKSAKKHSVHVRGYLSCVLGCPYEGTVSLDKTTELAQRFLDIGCYEISLGDTIGVGTAHHVMALLEKMNQKISIDKIAVHFHDTYGQALVNIYAALQCGVSVIDTAIAGLGGCPYASGASGNVATEDVLYMLNGLHIETGVDLKQLIAISYSVCNMLACKNHSKVALASAHY